MAFPPGMRAASSGAHDFVAEGGASALGSVASFGWIAPQAANRQAQPADNFFKDFVLVGLPRLPANEHGCRCNTCRSACVMLDLA